MLFLRLHNNGVLVTEVFWGLWLFPFGLRVYGSRFLTRLLGVWLMIISGHRMPVTRRARFVQQS